MASSTLLPFLYQTRTLQRACSLSAGAILVRRLHDRHNRPSARSDNSIPFEWDQDGRHESMGQEHRSTITPPEAEIFKSIFDEIAQGKMSPARKRHAASPSTTDPLAIETDSSKNTDEQLHIKARSIVEQARATGFRDRFLQRSPESLREAAQVALGLYELDPGSGSEVGSGGSRMLELEEADRSKWAVRAWYDQTRSEERARVDALMQGCASDVALWEVMEKEVFSLPQKLGIVQRALTKAKGKRGASKKASRGKASRDAKAAAERDEQAGSEEEKRIMDIHGPLYPHYISAGLALFDTAFAHPSLFAFNILPRVKELGLPSYVLGVSAPFYSRLAQIHWDRYGDANSALDLIHEMTSAGLYAPDEVTELLGRIRDHLNGCALGVQGPFVMAMMEAPPYDGALMQRLDDVERFARQAFMENSR